MNVRGLLKNNKVMAGIDSVLFWAIMALLLSCVYLISNNYSAVYGFPTLENGIADLTSQDFSKDGTWVNPIGKAKFYFDKWVVSDNESLDDPAYVTVPGAWSNEGFPNEGYGTYIYQFDGLKVGDKVSVFQQDTTAAHIFIQDGDNKIMDHLTTGEMSKTSFHEVYQETVQGDIYHMFSNSLKIYVEYGFTPYGGEYRNLLIQTTKPGSLSLDYVIIVSAGLAVILSCILLSGIAFLPFRKNNMRIPFFVLSVMLFVDYVFTDLPLLVHPQGGSTFIPVYVMDYWHIICLLITFVVSTVLAVRFKILEKPKNFKCKWPYVVGACLLITVTSFTLCYRHWYSIFSTIPVLAFSTYMVYKAVLQRRSIKPDEMKIPIALIALFFFFIGYYIFSMAWVSSTIVFSLATFHSMFAVIFAITSTSSNLSFTNKCNAEIQKAENNRHQLIEAKNEALIKQIQPHFLFNSLNTVSSQYHSSIDDGDKATLLLSNNLRASIDAGSKALIPFGSELDNITNYADFTNLAYQNKVDVLFDIGYENFSVPPLSIQVFVENSFKHGKLSSKDDSMVIISSKEEDGKIIIKIKDNGCGFDSSKPIGEGHSGIKNGSFRLKSSLNATVSIKSEIGKGTEVTISIPLAEPKVE